jgi:hypothetical protein
MEFMRIHDLDCPVAALDLLLELERHPNNFCCSPIEDQRSVSVWPSSELTPHQKLIGSRYKAHLFTLLMFPGMTCTCPRCRDLANVPLNEFERAQLERRLQLGKKQPQLIE